MAAHCTAPALQRLPRAPNPTSSRRTSASAARRRAATANARRPAAKLRATATPGDDAGAPSAAAAAAGVVVSERRAADVAVLGGSMAGLLAAYSLAKSGRKVLLLPSFGLASPSAAAAAARQRQQPQQPQRQQPLKLPDPDPLLVHLASESAAYWRGLQALAGGPLLAQQGSADVVLDPEADHAGAAGFNALQEACAAAGVPVSLLSGAEAAAAHRLLQLPPHRSSVLAQREGAVIDAAQAAGVARQLAEKTGVMLRDGLVLRGWRDRGSCFELRAASRVAPGLTCLYEVEVLLLAPGAWHSQCLGLFGLQLTGLQASEVLRCRLPLSSPELLLQQPLVQTWGAAVAADAPQQPEGVALLPSGIAGDGSIGLQQLPAWGLPVQQPWDWAPASLASLLQQEQGEQQEQGSSNEPKGQQQQNPASARDAWVQLQVAQLHATAAQLLRGVAPLRAADGSSGVLSCSSSVAASTADGRPLVDFHPGFDAGRVMLCCAVGGGQRFGPGSSGSYQLSPMLAKLAADAIRAGGYSSGSSSSSSEGSEGSGGGTTSASSSPDGAVLGALRLQRPGMGAASVLQGIDGWEGLGTLQGPAAASAQQQEEQQDLEADAARDRVGTRQ